MLDPDLRWVQHFSNYKKAFLSLKEAITLSRQRALTALEAQGLIKGFEHTFELGWKTLKDHLKYMQVDARFPRKVMKSAFEYELIQDGDIWMEMLEKRNVTAHTYDEAQAQNAYELITTRYYPQLEKLFTYFEAKLQDESIRD